MRQISMKLLPIVVMFGAASLLPKVAGAQRGGNDYRLGPKDLVEIKVLEVPDLNGERRVSDNGSISLPLLGEVDATGLTATEFEDRLEALLTAKFVNRANVSVVIKEFGSRPVSILGAVKKPGYLGVSGRWDLLQAVSAAGGLEASAGRRIFVLRRGDNGFSDRLEIDRDDLLVRSSPRWNIPIYPGDVVNVPPRSAIRLFILGEVKSPGALEFDLEDRITLLTVIARAGGLTDRAARGSIRIKRRAADGRDVELVADYRRIVSGRDADPPLRADDVVIVKESFF